MRFSGSWDRRGKASTEGKRFKEAHETVTPGHDSKKWSDLEARLRARAALAPSTAIHGGCAKAGPAKRLAAREDPMLHRTA